jgi:hypothetical protein
MGEFLTDEQLLRIFAAMRTPREARPTTLEAAPPAGQLPNHWNLPELDLRVHLEAIGTGVRLRLTGGEAWRGALVYCRWDWLDSTQPDKEVPESLHAFLLMPTEGFRGFYQREVDIPERLTFQPILARIVPKYADPAVFEQQWRDARVKPSLQELRQWIEAHQNEFPPRHRETWRDMPDRLAAEG